jgi:hypothetical protein
MAAMTRAGLVRHDLMITRTHRQARESPENSAASNSYFHYFASLQNILSRTTHGQRR